ncbi:nuclear GTPase SLIP-GC-like [Sparus aurata]|uniref:nuclear GTPase SLIP-GC-like n=1 Tax=Sparus aurata TaxID=8175 RepID=UPI0011C0EF16|nr:nuclear GTPase SLIP-GC-like [Sparus aurata]
MLIFKRRFKLLKGGENTTNQEKKDSPAQLQQMPEEAAESDQVLPSTSVTKDKGKRKLDLQGESSKWHSPPTKRKRDSGPGSYSEEFLLSDVKTIMRFVQQRLPNQDNRLNNFLKNKINDLKTEKRVLVGVFGKTGAGKSSLINAVIGEKNLLPSGSISACTSVMIKVEANMKSPKYEADIEFITKEEWKDELWSLLNFLGDNADQGNDQDEEEDYRDIDEKLLAVYGEEWRNKSPEDLMDNKYFKEVPEFLQSKRKILTCESAKELSAKCAKYTKNDSKDGDGKLFGISRNTADVWKDLEEKISHGLVKVKRPIEEAYVTFEKCLSEGVEKSESSCDKVLKSILQPRGVSLCYSTLKCVVENGGVHKPKKKKKKPINLNVKLASCLTDSIDEEFKKTFPNERKCGAFNGVINTFSLDTEGLIQKYKDVELQLTFLKTEEEKVKMRLNESIRECKKLVYNSLTKIIEENMKDCYQKAAGFRGKDSLKNMRDTIKQHVHSSKNTMFKQAKDVMLGRLRKLKGYILKELKETMRKSIMMSLKTDDYSLPDFTVELAEVKKHYNDLMKKPRRRNTTELVSTCSHDALIKFHSGTCKSEKKTTTMT